MVINQIAAGTLIAFMGLTGLTGNLVVGEMGTDVVTQTAVGTMEGTQVSTYKGTEIAQLEAGRVSLMTPTVTFLGVVGMAEGGVNASSFIGKNDTLVSSVVSSVNNEEGVNVLKYEPGTGILTFNNRVYSELTNKEKNSYMETALKAIQNSDMNAQRKNKMYNFVAEQDSSVSKAISRFSRNVKADSAGAFALLSPFQRGFSIFLGVIVSLTLMGLVLSILLDLAYLTIPFVGLFADKHAVNGEGVKKPWFVSDAASYARTASENSVGSGQFKSSVVEYVRKRIMHVFLVILLAMLLVTGGIYQIVGIIGDALGF